MPDSHMIPKKPFARSFRRWWNKKIGTSKYRYRGVLLVTDQKRVSEDVYNAVFSQQYEDTEAAIIGVKVRQGDRVLEVGAGVGFVSILCAQLAGDQNVRSFEANPDMEPLIRENYNLNNVAPNLEMKAVTRDGAPVQFHVSNNILSSSLYDRSLDGKEINVESVALSSLVEDWQPTVLVMDVEGAEIDLLGHDALAGLKRIILEVHPHIVGEEAVETMLSRLEARGFQKTFKYRKSVLLEMEDG